MILSHRKKFILLNIYKTATESVNPLFGTIQDLKGGTVLPLKHLPADVVCFKWEKEWATYYKATIVRNPWDWQVSQYFFLKSQPELDKWNILPRFKEFDSFIRWRCEYVGRLLGHHIQTGFLRDSSDEITLNFIGRMEELLKDVNYILKQLRMEPVTKILHRNATPLKKDYRGYYTPETRELVEKAFSLDVKNFRYNFDGHLPWDERYK